MKNILVTGGAGYIGSHTCKQLFNSGYNPIVYDNLSTGHKEFVKWGNLIIGDLHDTDKLVSILREYIPVAVIHFAASAYVGESVINPFKYYKNNVSGTLSLLEAMLITGVNKFVFSSTCATYGVPECNSIDESTPQIPINPYGRSKLMIEQILRDLSINDQLRYVALRYFNAAGADPESELGEWHEPETHLIPLAINSFLGGPKLQIFGSDFPTPDGTAVRDYIHVYDLAIGHIRALEYLLNDGCSDEVNLGSGVGTSVKDIISALGINGIDVSYEYSDRRKGDPAYLVANPAKAMNLFGWRPKYTSLNDLLKTAVDWHQS